MNKNNENPPVTICNSPPVSSITKKRGRPKLTDEEKESKKKERNKKKLKENVSEEATENHRKANLKENMSQEATDKHREANIKENMSEEAIKKQNNKLKNSKEKKSTYKCAIKYTIDEFNESNIEVKFYNYNFIYFTIIISYFIILGRLSWTNGSNLSILPSKILESRRNF